MQPGTHLDVKKVNERFNVNVKDAVYLDTVEDHATIRVSYSSGKQSVVRFKKEVLPQLERDE